MDTTPATYEPVTELKGLGPAMRAINPQQRAFVMAYFDTGGQDYAKAARLAGYAPGNMNSSKIAGWRLAHDQRVLEAIREWAESRLKSHAILGAEVLIEIAKDPTHKDRMKAAIELMNRSGMIVAQKHEHEHIHRAESDQDKIERIVQLSKTLGVDAKKLLGSAGVTLDAEFTVVQSKALPAPVDEGSADGLEDLL